MRPVSLVLLVVLAVATAFSQVGGLTALPTTTYSSNLLLNPGFETASPLAWTNTGMSRVTDVKRTGAASDYYLYDNDTYPYGQDVTQTVSITAGTYKLSAYVKTASVGGGGTGVRLCMGDGDAWPTCSEVISGTQDWTLVVVDKVPIAAPLNSAIVLQRYGLAAGEAWIDDVVLLKEVRPISAYLLHPNYRGMLYSDESQTVRFNVAVEPPSGTMGDYHVHAVVTDESTSTVVAAPSFTASASFTAGIDFSAFTTGHVLSTVFSLILTADDSVIDTYPAYNVIKSASTNRALLPIGFDENNRFLFSGTPAFLLGVYDGDMNYVLSTAVYERMLTGERRLSELPANIYLNLTYGAAPNDAITPLMDVLSGYGMKFWQMSNCFSTYPVTDGFWWETAPPGELAIRTAHAAFGGVYVADECVATLAADTFSHRARNLQYNPTGVTVGFLAATASETALWRDAADILGNDPYPLYGAEPAGGYPLNTVATWVGYVKSATQSARPIATVLQAFKGPGTSRWPTQAELRNMSYMAIAEGSNGLFYWTLGQCGSCEALGNLWTDYTAPSVTKGNPTVFNITGHDFPANGYILTWGATGDWAGLNWQNYNVTVIDADHISVPVNSTSFSGSYDGLIRNFWPPARMDYFGRLKNVMVELNAIKAPLASLDYASRLLTASNDSIHTRVKKDGSTYYLIASNNAGAPQNATFTWAANVGSVTVYAESRTLPPTGAQFTDSFGAYEAHVYQITEGEALAPFSDFAIDVKSHSTARIGWTTDGVITNWDLEWDTRAAPPFANATSYRNDSRGPTWYYGFFTAGSPTSIYVPYGHGCRTGYKLLVSGATGGWAPLNGVRTCTYTDANHFTLDADTTGASGNSIGTARYLRWEQTLAGLPANTTIYYRVCKNSGAACSDVQNFATDAAPADVYANPTLPTASGALTVPPASFARTEATVTNCANLQSAINTALGRGETGHVLLPIQKGLHCSFTANPGLSIGANTNTGYLVIRPDSADVELPPSGVRISTAWEGSMVTLSGASFVGGILMQLTATSRIYLMGIVFENDFPTASTKAITGATTAAPIVYTSAGHGFSNNDIVQIREVGGVTGANVTNCKVQNATSSTFECKGSSGTGAYISGGYAVKTPPRAPHALFGNNLTSITIDRCIVRHVWPATGSAGAIWFRHTEGASSIRNTDINLINSYVYDVNDWVPVDPDTGERATCCSNTPYEGMIVITGDRVLVQNNKLDVPGIGFFDDGWRITDLTFRRNLNDWNTAWKYASASTGWPVTVRQQFEMKSCFRCKLDGNQWLNQWHGGLGQGTGGYSIPILFSGRSGDYEEFGEYGFGDITITNNLIADAPGGISIGNAGGYQADQKPIRNVLISNNLMYGIDWGKMDATPGNGNQSYGAPAFLVLGGPFENLRVENNTLWDNRRWNSSYSPWNAGLSFLGGGRGAYFHFHNNFLAHNPDGVYDVLVWPGTSAEMKPTPVTSGVGIVTSKFLHDVDWGGNVVVPGVTDSRLEANYTDPSKNYPRAACASYWTGRSGIACHDGHAATAYANFAAIGFVDYANRDFRLKDGSLYASGGARRGSDDKNLGADADAIDGALGKVKNVRVREISSSGATLSYSAPDTDACTVEYGLSAGWGTGSRSSDGGGDRGRNVTLGGLSGGTTYYYRLLCAAEQPSGSFQTP